MKHNEKTSYEMEKKNTTVLAKMFIHKLFSITSYKKTQMNFLANPIFSNHISDKELIP